jgi:hypothetical protein
VLSSTSGCSRPVASENTLFPSPDLAFYASNRTWYFVCLFLMGIAAFRISTFGILIFWDCDLGDFVF